MKYLNISIVPTVALIVSITSGVHAASVGGSQSQAVFSIQPDISVCRFNDSSGTSADVSQCTSQDADMSKLPMASFTILEQNFNPTGTNVSIAGFSLINEEESDVFTLRFEDSGLIAANFVNPIFSIMETAVPADFSLYDSKLYDDEIPLSFDVAAVPLPGAVWLLGSGPLLAGFVQKKRIAT